MRYRATAKKLTTTKGHDGVCVYVRAYVCMCVCVRRTGIYIGAHIHTDRNARDNLVFPSRRLVTERLAAPRR